MNIANNLQKAADAIKEADALLITTGTGIQASLNLPELTNDHYFKTTYPFFAKKNITFAQMISPYIFEAHPAEAWGFYGKRIKQVQSLQPNKTYTALKQIAEYIGLYFIYTTTVDGVFQKFFFDNKRIAEALGSTRFLQCTKKCSNELYETDLSNLEINETFLSAKEPLPACPRCNALLRPNIHFLNDITWNNRESAQQANQLHLWTHKLKAAKYKTVVLEIGAGVSHPFARNESEGVVQDVNATLIRINPRYAQVPRHQISIPLSAEEALARICELIKLTT